MIGRDERILNLRRIIMFARGCACPSCASDTEWAREQLRAIECGGDSLATAQAAIHATLAKPVARTLPWPFGGAR